MSPLVSHLSLKLAPLTPYISVTIKVRVFTIDQSPLPRQTEGLEECNW